MIQFDFSLFFFIFYYCFQLDDTDRSLEMGGGDAVGSCIASSHEGEQEVPLGSYVLQEEQKCNEVKETGWESDQI